MALAKNMRVYRDLGDALNCAEIWLKQDYQKQHQVVAEVVAKMKQKIENICNDEAGNPQNLFMEINRLHHHVKQVILEKQRNNLSPAERGLRFNHEQHDNNMIREDDVEEEEIERPKLTNRIALDLPDAQKDLMQSKKLLTLLETLRKKGRDPEVVFNGRCQTDSRGIYMLVKLEDLTGFDATTWKRMKSGERIATLERALFAIAEKV